MRWWPEPAQRWLNHVTSERLFWGFLAILGGFALWRFPDYGVTWDEDLHAYYGELILRYYTSWMQDRSALDWWNLYIYGGAFDVPATLLTQISPLGYYETRHAFNAAIGLVGIVGTWKLARALGGPRAALIAAVSLALTPNYLGHMFNNPKDIPFAVGMVWGIYYLVLMSRSLPTVPLSLACRLGVAVGLTAGVRIGGVLLIAYLGLMIGVLALWRGWTHRSLRRALLDLAEGLARAVVPVVAIGYPVLLLFWPYAQQAPISNPLAALLDFSHHAYGYQVLFDGVYYWPKDLPWTYVPTYILLNLPELLVLLLAGAAVSSLWALSRAEIRHDARRVVALALPGFAIVFPIAYAVAINAIVFNGMRHFLFVLPPLAVIAALMLDRLVDRLAALGWGRAVAAGLALYVGYHLSVLARLHPNEYVYYNAFIGGVEGAEGHYKLDYWGNSYAEAVHGLEQVLRERYGGEFESRTFKIRICGPKVAAKYYFPRNFVEAENDREADFVISLSNYVPAATTVVELDECRQVMAGIQIYTVERMNVLLSVVIDRRALKIETASRTPSRQRLLGTP